MESSPEKLVKKHQQLTHSEVVTVTSHVQRTAGDWIFNTLMIDGCDVPFKYKRTKHYKNLNLLHRNVHTATSEMNVELTLIFHK